MTIHYLTSKNRRRHMLSKGWQGVHVINTFKNKPINTRNLKIIKKLFQKKKRKPFLNIDLKLVFLSLKKWQWIQNYFFMECQSHFSMNCSFLQQMKLNLRSITFPGTDFSILYSLFFWMGFILLIVSWINLI